MPKKDYILKDFSGGWVDKRSSANLEDNECALLDNLRGDIKGRIRAGVGMSDSSSSSAIPAYTFMPGEGVFAGWSDYVIKGAYASNTPGSTHHVMFDDDFFNLTPALTNNYPP